MTQESVYVYGVVASDARVDIDDAGLGAVRAVSSGGVAALCSDVPDRELLGRRSELKAHADVLGAACLQTTVVPLSFGTVLPGDDAVAGDLLTAHADHLHGELQRLDGLVQLNVRLVPVEEHLLADVVAGWPELARLRDSVRAAGDTASQAQRIRLGEAASNAYQAAAEQIGRAAVDSLSQLSVDTSVEQVGGPDGTTKAAFLVSRGTVTEFLDEAERVAEGLRGRARCRVVGPLPAFSFVQPFPALTADDREGSWAS